MHVVCTCLADASDVSAQHEAEKAALQHALDEKSSELHRAVQQVDEARRVSLSITLGMALCLAPSGTVKGLERSLHRPRRVAKMVRRQLSSRGSSA